MSSDTTIALLEKAYARTHGDYGATEDLYVGDVLEDFTGGVTVEFDLFGNLSSDIFWKELRSAQDEFAVLASNRRIEAGVRSNTTDRSVLVTVRKTVDLGTHRLLLLHDSGPGFWEWTGPWSDGSSEWTPSIMKSLNHKFGDDWSSGSVTRIFNVTSDTL